VEEQICGDVAARMKRVKELDVESAKLKCMYAELALENIAMK
jgi:hypothetical protein